MAKELSEFETALMVAIRKEFNRRFCIGPHSDIRSGQFYPDRTSHAHFKFRIYHNAYYLTVNLRFDENLIHGVLKISSVKNDATVSLCNTAAIYDGYIDLKDPAMDIDSTIGMMMPTIDTFKKNADNHAKFLKESLPFVTETVEEKDIV